MVTSRKPTVNRPYVTSPTSSGFRAIAIEVAGSSDFSVYGDSKTTIEITLNIQPPLKRSHLHSDLIPDAIRKERWAEFNLKDYSLRP